MKGAADIKCDYCGESAKLTRGPHGWIWECVPCDARVAAHKDSPTKKPMGRLANAELRAAKTRAHAAFDPLWQAALDRRIRESGNLKSGKVRSEAYEWLSAQLGIDPRECHFALFDLRQCREVVEICNAHTPPFMHGGR